jgi:flagellar basal body-associated protein FliL
MRYPSLPDEPVEDASLHSMKTIIWIAVAVALFVAVLLTSVGVIARFGASDAPPAHSAPAP